MVTHDKSRPDRIALEKSSHSTWYDAKWKEATEEGTVPIDEERAAVILQLAYKWLPVGDARDPQPRILDLGCGVGWLTERLNRFGDAQGVDSSAIGIELAAKRYPSVSFKCLDFLTNPDDGALGQFDLVVCSEVIEHVPDEAKEQFVRTVERYLAPHGVCIITTPNKLVWDHYWKKPDSEKWRQPIEDWCTPRSLRRLFQETRCLECFTYKTDFRKEGVYRWLNSTKLNFMAEMTHLHHLFERLKSWRWGLYIAAAFQRRTTSR